MTLHEMPDLIQGTDEWLQQRCGIITASVVGKLLTSTLKVADNDTARGVTATLTAERITGYIDQTFVSADMWRGVEDEPKARDTYAEHWAPVTETGFMVRDDWGFKIGYSPDGLVGDDGLIEAKSRRQKAHLQTILADAVPAYNMAQLQCGLLVSGRKWIDYLSYCGGMPMWRKRIMPDPKWFAAILSAATQFEQNASLITANYEMRIKGLPTTERTPDYQDMEVA